MHFSGPSGKCIVFDSGWVSRFVLSLTQGFISMLPMYMAHTHTVIRQVALLHLLSSMTEQCNCRASGGLHLSCSSLIEFMLIKFALLVCCYTFVDMKQPSVLPETKQ